jgi:hypothetical protein
MESYNILNSLVEKHMIQKREYEGGNYETLPCGEAMTLCNNAFVDLASRIDDILAASFDEVPKGDKDRVGKVAERLLLLLSNAFYSITWVNGRYYVK